MSIELRDGKALAATFTNTGDLVSFVSHGIAWTLREASPCCGIALALADLSRQILLPDAGSGQVVSAGDTSIEVLYPRLNGDDGTELAAPIRVHWRLADGLLQGSVCLEQLSAQHVLHALIFPRLAIPVSPEGGLIWPRLEGVSTRMPVPASMPMDLKPPTNSPIPATCRCSV